MSEQVMVRGWGRLGMGLGLAAMIALAAGLGCSGSSPAGPSPVPPGPDAPRMTVPLPRPLFGAFVGSGDVHTLSAAGNMALVVPTYADDPQHVANALMARGLVAVVSAHHVFGGGEEGWEEGWAATKQWMAPLPVGAVYVVDEPLLNGLSVEKRDRAVARVRADGYMTIVGEDLGKAEHNSRPPVDLYGVTCYDWPGFGSHTQQLCLERYRDHPDWNLVIGQAFDLQARNGSAEEQLSRWAALGREREGVVFWVWSWPGQTGIRAAYRSAYEKAWDVEVTR